MDHRIHRRDGSIIPLDKISDINRLLPVSRLKPFPLCNHFCISSFFVCDIPGTAFLKPGKTHIKRVLPKIRQQKSSIPEDAAQTVG